MRVWLAGVNWVEDALMPAVICAVVVAGVAHYYPQAREAQVRQRAEAASHARSLAIAPEGHAALPR